MALLLIDCTCIAALFVYAIYKVLTLFLEKKSRAFGAFIFLRNIPGGKLTFGVFFAAVEYALFPAVLYKDLGALGQGTFRSFVIGFVLLHSGYFAQA